MKRDVLLVALLLLSGIAIGLTIGLNLRTRSARPVQSEDVAVAETRPVPGASHKPVGWRQVEKGVKSLNRQNSRWFLLRTRIPDFGEELKRSHPISEVDPGWNGCFSGEIHLIDGRVWKIETEIGITQAAPAEGSISIQLSENGTIFNHLSDNGPLKELKSFGQPSNAAILEISDNHFLQVYRNEDLWFANYYEPVKLMEFALKGTAILERQACHG